jgi:diguanylate cyclase (GGDEF)-like protein/PAS domain S-box-containing protein
MAQVIPIGMFMGAKNNVSQIQQEFGALLDAAPDAMIIIDTAGSILAANSYSERMFGYHQAQLIGLSVEQLLPERFRGQHVGHRIRFAQDAGARPMGSGRVGLFGLRADGAEFPVEISLKPLEIGGKRVVAAAVRDITLRQQTEDKLRVLSTALENKHASLQAVLDSLTEGVIVFSLDGQVLDANPAAIQMFEAKSLNQVLKTFHDFALDFHICGFDGTHLPVEQWPCARIARGETVANVELEVWSKRSGQRMFISYCGAPIKDQSGQPVLGVCTMRDITEHKQAEDRVRRASLHDALTGLPNRALLFEYSRHVFASTRRNQHHAAVLFVDLDRFKPINDLHGHEVGDAVLKEVAQRLTASTRQEDIVFRLGGDEFLLILPDIEDGAYAGTVADHLVHAINQPYYVDELELSLSASIGISVYPRDSDDIDTLINQADIAMYHAKHSGRGCYQFYSAALNERLNAKTMIERHLKTALMDSQFQLYYQPVVDISTGDVLSVEALLRWPHAEIGPDRFIPVAEATGMIGRLGDWVIIEACRQHNRWIDNGLPAIPIAVNVSAVQFCQPNFVGSFCKAMEGCYANPKAITVEVTETALMGDIELAINQLSELRSLGIKVALDDFGTGYSSLSYLSRLPLDKLKVDKSFIYRIGHDAASRTITEAIITLGHTLHLEIVAEGIESVNVLEYLHSHGCDQAQGHHICEPINAGAFESWYRNQSHQASFFKHRNDYHGRQKLIGGPY